MDNQPPSPPRPAMSPAAPTPPKGKSSRRSTLNPLVISIVVLAIALVGVFVIQMTQLNSVKRDGETTQQKLQALQAKQKQEDEFAKVDPNKLQAIFLNNGQVYFGSIKTINDKFYKLVNIYYLKSGASVTPQTVNAPTGDVSLVKLGCELHKPSDEMIINRGEATFWENLQPDGEVAKAIASYQKQNPNGQECPSAS